MSITFQEMKDVDVRTVDPSTLADCRDIEINPELPREVRILQFLEQIKNPYCFKFKDTVVKIKFADTNATLEERLTQLSHNTASPAE